MNPKYRCVGMLIVLVVTLQTYGAPARKPPTNTACSEVKNMVLDRLSKTKPTPAQRSQNMQLYTDPSVPAIDSATCPADDALAARAAGHGGGTATGTAERIQCTGSGASILCCAGAGDVFVCCSRGGCMANIKIYSAQ